MGTSALDSHAKGDRHNKNMKKITNMSLYGFLQPKTIKTVEDYESDKKSEPPAPSLPTQSTASTGTPRGIMRQIYWYFE